MSYNSHPPEMFAPTYGEYGDYGEALLSASLPDTYRADTAEFQSLLVAAGYGAYLGPKGADGFFGTGTSNATKAYQTRNSLAITGVADQATWNSLKSKGGGNATGAIERPAAKTSWQDNLGLFASSLGTSISSAFTGQDAAATQDKPPAGSYVPPKKSVMPWVFGGVGLLVVAGGVFYYVNSNKNTKKGKK